MRTFLLAGDAPQSDMARLVEWRPADGVGLAEKDHARRPDSGGDV
jgi:hypothetical protein